MFCKGFTVAVMNNEGVQRVFPTMSDSLVGNPICQEAASGDSINITPGTAVAREKRPRPLDFGNRGTVPIATAPYRQSFIDYTRENSLSPLLLEGDAIAVLRDIPAESIDCVMTSPPYWGKREYENGGIGLEHDYRDFVKHLAAISLEV